MKIINIGLYPPPFGGVSIHIKRLKEHLEEEGIDNAVIDLSGWNTKEKVNDGINVMAWRKSIVYLLFHKKAILHFHNFSWKNTFIYCILGFKHFTVLSFHNERFLSEIERVPRIVRKLIIKFINTMNYIIVDSLKCHMLAEEVIEHKSKILIVPEFIPPFKIPILGEQSFIMKMRKQHNFLISSNAFQICFHNDVDLYGIDMLIELTARLNKEDIDAVCCFLLPRIGDDSYFVKLKEKIKKFNIEDKFMFITDYLEEATSLWQVSDLVVRATNTDGNSLSIYESLSVGVPVIASDCVPRPEGVILFRTRDFDDLYKKVKAVLSNIERFKESINKLNVENNAYKIIELYKFIMLESNN